MNDVTKINLEEIKALVTNVFLKQGCNKVNAEALARTITKAEEDGASSHGLFRLPGYVASLKSGKVNGHASPKVKNITPVILQCDADNGFASMAHEKALPMLAEAAKINGISVLSIKGCYHFAALWPETEYLALQNLVGFACTAFKPSVAPAGAKEAFFGTNPISMAWPRKNNFPVVFDMATATMAKGEVMIAARDGHMLPDGVGLGENGEPSNDPKEVLKGVLLPFGGYKGSAISMMVELFAAGLTGDVFSYEAQENDNNDGGPPSGGEFIMALNPEIIGDSNWEKHCEDFFQKLLLIEGVRLPGSRRHKKRSINETRSINEELLLKVKSYL
ncbi:Ldh family oxidoreductase [Alphaproteobacteria bacterium]|nr:Ldh family oxidoreductase [Alphaproteobacteria bacterium]